MDPTSISRLGYMYIICKQLLLWFGLWFVFARTPRATWVFMFADGWNPHSRCVFGGDTMVIERDKFPPSKHRPLVLSHGKNPTSPCHWEHTRKWHNNYIFHCTVCSKKYRRTVEIQFILP